METLPGACACRQVPLLLAALLLAPGMLLARTPVGMVAGPPGVETNQNYGFAITIPPGVRAWRSAPPNPNHGILITLGPDRRIYASASFDVLELGSTKGQMDEILQDVKNIQTREALAWDGQAAEQARFVRGRVLTLVRAQYRPEGKILYELRLETSAGMLHKDQQLFTRLANSFRQIPRQ
jgi:hypothetical protein